MFWCCEISQKCKQNHVTYTWNSTRYFLHFRKKSVLAVFGILSQCLHFREKEKVNRPTCLDFFTGFQKLVSRDWLIFLSDWELEIEMSCQNFCHFDFYPFQSLCRAYQPGFDKQSSYFLNKNAPLKLAVFRSLPLLLSGNFQFFSQCKVQFCRNQVEMRLWNSSFYWILWLWF